MANHRANPQLTTPCGNAGCNCPVDPDEEFCSDYCAQAGQREGEGGGALLGEPHAANGECGCGHPDCD